MNALRPAQTNVGAHSDEAEAQAAAKAAGIGRDDIVEADWHPIAFSPAAMVAVDHLQGWVVLAVRGTLNGHDTLTDTCADHTPFLGGFAHAGFAAAAWQASIYQSCLMRKVKL